MSNDSYEFYKNLWKDDKAKLRALEVKKNIEKEQLYSIHINKLTPLYENILKNQGFYEEEDKYVSKFCKVEYINSCVESLSANELNDLKDYIKELENEKG